MWEAITANALHGLKVGLPLITAPSLLFRAPILCLLSYHLVPLGRESGGRVEWLSDETLLVSYTHLHSRFPECSRVWAVQGSMTCSFSSQRSEPTVFSLLCLWAALGNASCLPFLAVSPLFFLSSTIQNTSQGNLTEIRAPVCTWHVAVVCTEGALFMH